MRAEKLYQQNQLVDTTWGSGLYWRGEDGSPFQHQLKGPFPWPTSTPTTFSFLSRLCRVAARWCAAARSQGDVRTGADGAIVYLAAGPSVYTTATVPQLARYLGAEVADIRRE